MSLLLLFRPRAYVAPPPSSTGIVDRFFIHVDDFGAVPDSVHNAPSGTDSTAAINAALASTKAGGVNAGKTVLIGPGAYKTTGPIVHHEGTSLVAMTYTRNGAVSNDQMTYATRIDFYGGATDNCIQAVGTSSVSLSKVTTQGLKLVDRRTTATSGNGIHYQKCVNQSIIRGCDIHGFGGGSSIYLFGGGAGLRSDCITVDDVWVGMGGSTGRPDYGIFASGVDNILDIRDVKIDTTTSGDTVAAIHLEYCSAAVNISSVKHENVGSIPTIVVSTQAYNVNIRGVAGRIGNGTTLGPLVQFTGENTGAGTTIESLWRSSNGSLVKRGGASPFDITGTHLPFFTGLGFSAKSFHVLGEALVHGGSASLAGATKNLGFYGSTGTTKPTITGDTATATATVLSDLIAALAAQGLLTDSST